MEGGLILIKLNAKDIIPFKFDVVCTYIDSQFNSYETIMNIETEFY